MHPLLEAEARLKTKEKEAALFESELARQKQGNFTKKQPMEINIQPDIVQIIEAQPSKSLKGGVNKNQFIASSRDNNKEKELQEQSLRAFEILGTSGWGRVDFLLDDEGKAWFLEVNTTPGMTDHSLVPQAAAEIGIGFDDLIWRILETSL